MEAFLKQSRVFQDGITNSFHLVNTARAGIELLSASIQKIVDAGLDDRVIAALYPTPEGTTGQNLRAMTLRSEEAKEADLAAMWLFAVFARYESWAESLEPDLAIPDAKKACQFIDVYDQVFRALPPAGELHRIYAFSISNDRFYLGGHGGVRDALRVYRYYKEIRNSLIHATGEAEPRLVAAANAARTAAEALRVSVGWRGAPIPAVQVGDAVEVSFAIVRDVIALLQRLVFSIDSTVLESALGAAEIERRWKSQYGEERLVVQERKLGRAPWYSEYVSRRLGVPRPVQVGDRHGRTWGETERNEFTNFAVSRDLLHVNRWG